VAGDDVTEDFFAIDQPQPPSSSNGLPAQAWVALGAIDPRLAEPLLDALRNASVGAYVAPFSSRRGNHLEVRLWVDANLRAEAERVVTETLPELRESVDEPDDDGWSSIVASFESSPDADTPPWPEAEGYTSSADEAVAAYTQSRPQYDDPEEHFVPPDPAPLPPTSRGTRYGWLALLGGIVVLVVPALFGHAIGTGLLFIAIVAIVVGFLSLVLRLKDGPSDDDNDDGAVV
jgi:hypothetical protein